MSKPLYTSLICESQTTCHLPAQQHVSCLPMASISDSQRIGAKYATTLGHLFLLDLQRLMRRAVEHTPQPENVGILDPKCQQINRHGKGNKKEVNNEKRGRTSAKERGSEKSTARDISSNAAGIHMHTRVFPSAKTNARRGAITVVLPSPIIIWWHVERRS